MIEFKPFPKLARLNRDIVITEKIDGTNAAVGVTEDGEVYAQSRTRLIWSDKDNFGFARWVADHAEGLRFALGAGLHFGEWWGPGIQRGYDVPSKRFSLFNVARWGQILPTVPFEGTDEFGLENLLVVPTLYEGPFSQEAIDLHLKWLRSVGSIAARGYKNPEGIVIFHKAAGVMFKVTLENDESPKSQVAA